MTSYFQTLMTAGIKQPSRTHAAPAYFFLLLASAVTTYWSMQTTVLIWDDLVLPEYFRNFNDAGGYVKGAFSIFFGQGMVGEYRTYGLSRLLQMIIWDTIGTKPVFYACWITVSQGATAMVLYALLRRCAFAHFPALLIPTLWIFSPFSLTHCFHHYTYLIFPVQILLALALIATFISQGDGALSLKEVLSATVGGIALALTGEAHIFASCTLLAMFFRRPRQSRINRWLALLFSAMGTALLLHYSIWQHLSYDPAVPQRFSLSKDFPTSFAVLESRWVATLASVYNGFCVQVSFIVGIARLNLLIGLAAGLVAYGIIWLIARRIENGEQRQDSKAEFIARDTARRRSRLIGAIAIVSFASISLDLLLMLTTGAIYDVFPRRYGYVPYTAFCITVVALLPLVFKRKVMQTVGALLFSTYFALYVCLQLFALPQIRREDSLLAEKILAMSRRPGTQGVLIQSRFGPIDRVGGVNWWTPGLRGGGIAMDIAESPFVSYWVQALYLRNVVGLAHVGWKVESTGADSVELALADGVTHMNAEASHIAVVANMGVNAEFPTLSEVRTFDAWSDYRTLVARGSVDQGNELVGGFTLASSGSRNFSVDLGRMQNQGLPGVFPDKLYNPTAPAVVPDNDLIAAYGLVEGPNSVYEVADPAIPKYYATNRNGDFTYRLDFKDLKGQPATLRMDFWELWARKAGERRFAVDLKVDASAWDQIAIMDVAKVKANAPIALSVELDAPRVVLIRLRRLEGSQDVPFMQGLRITSAFPPSAAK